VRLSDYWRQSADPSRHDVMSSPPAAAAATNHCSLDSLCVNISLNCVVAGCQQLYSVKYTFRISTRSHILTFTTLAVTYATTVKLKSKTIHNYKMSFHLRRTTGECVYFRSRDKDGGHIIRSTVAENPMLQANITALLSSIESELSSIEVSDCGNREFRAFCAA